MPLHDVAAAHTRMYVARGVTDVIHTYILEYLGAAEL
jgi:hypothetical protein